MLDSYLSLPNSTQAIIQFHFGGLLYNYSETKSKIQCDNFLNTTLTITNRIQNTDVINVVFTAQSMHIHTYLEFVGMMDIHTRLVF